MAPLSHEEVAADDDGRATGQAQHRRMKHMAYFEFEFCEVSDKQARLSKVHAKFRGMEE